ncbi:MAG: S24 family peptidase [Rhizomicrobium sp.]
MKHGIGKRVREARNALGISQAELGKRAGLGQQAIAEIESGRTRTSVHVVAIARALGRSPEWLEGATDPVGKSRQDVVELSGNEYARVPVYDIRFAAGAGSSNEDETPIDHYLISLSMLHSLTDAPVSQIAVFQADGDSMENTIFSRDWVFVDRRKTRLTNPGIYALIFEGDGLLKRAAQHLETGAVTLISDNAKYPPQTIKKPERLQVVGRVFMSIRRH